MKNNKRIRMRIMEKAVYGKRVFMSGISYYEIKRGLLAKNATRQLDIFETLCTKIRILFLDNQEIFDKASVYMQI